MKLINQTIAMISLVFCGASIASSQYNATIRGRVIDEKGRPVDSVSIRFDTNDEFQAKKCWVKDNSVLSNADGKFIHEEHCGVENRTVYLFLTQTTGFENVPKPIASPFWKKLRATDRRFAGIEVKLHGNQEIDLGSLPLAIWYNRVELSITDGHGQPFYKTDHNWSDFALVIRDEHGNAVGSKTLSISDRNHSIRLDRGSVELALPEGTWAAELLRSIGDLDRNGKTRRTLGKTVIRVKRTDVGAKARIVVQR